MTKKAVPKTKQAKKPTRAPKRREVVPQKTDAKQAQRDAIARDADVDRNLPPAELAIIDQAVQRNRARPTRLRARISPCEGGGWEMSPDFGSKTSHWFRQLDAFGTSSSEFASSSIGWLAAVARPTGKSMPTEQGLNAALTAVHSVEPENEMEAMLAVQMYGTYEVAMEMLVRAKQADTYEGLENYGNLATKLLRTYTTQVEALSKLRRRGEQTVRVEHVHVYPGGQAIVGNVTHPQQGGGGTQENGHQPHGPIDPQALAFTPGAPVWREEPSGNALPVPPDEGEDTVPVPRRSQGKRGPERRR